jgi:hypothetical protein
MKMILRNSIPNYCMGVVAGTVLAGMGALGLWQSVYHSDKPLGWLEKLGLPLWILLFSSITIRAAVQLLDRSIQLSVDDDGIHDFRSGNDISWKLIADIQLEMRRRHKAVSTADLNLRMLDSLTVQIDIVNLDQAPERILRNVTAMWKEALNG